MSFCVALGPDAPASRIGGKARSLVRLAAAGLPVPRAIVVTTDLYAALRADGPPLPATLEGPGALAALADAARLLGAAPWPPGFADALARDLDALAPDPDAHFSVRSSAAIEDEAGGLAPGLFLSRIDVSRHQVLEAVRAVLGSALAPAVVAYLARRGLPGEGLGFAILIHPFVAGEAAGAAASPPDASAPAIVEVRTGVAAALGATPRKELDDALQVLRAAHGPVEIEWVWAAGTLTFLQLRPYACASSVAPAGDGDRTEEWRWDAAHNPLPLSPAQAGLVVLVDERCATGFRQKVVGGYLFYAETPAPAPTSTEPALALRALSQAATRWLGRREPPLEEALETFTDVYRTLFAVVQPSARAKREALATFLRRHGLDPETLLPGLLTGVPSAATERARRARVLARAVSSQAQKAALAAYLDAFGDEAPCWDVAVPTWRERPAALERTRPALDDQPEGGAPGGRPWRDAADAVVPRLPPEARPEWEERLSDARAATGVAEDDDALYARIQAHVRNALLREGARLVARGVLSTGDEIFWLPLETVRRAARGEIAFGPEDAAPMIAAAQRADAEARANPPRLEAAVTIGHAGGFWPSARGAQDPEIIRGRPGAPGARIGRVRIYDAHSEHEHSPTQILVARTLLPTELPLLAPAALVVETGDGLGHVAAQARERGIPAVVGAVGACGLLTDGDHVLVDGGAGLVVRLG